MVGAQYDGNNFSNNFMGPYVHIYWSISTNTHLDDLSCPWTIVMIKKNLEKRFIFCEISPKTSIKISRVHDLLKNFLLDQRKNCIVTPIFRYMHSMGQLLIQFFMTNLNLAKSAISNLCRGCEMPIFLTSIELMVVAACAQCGDCLWLEY